MAAPRRTAQPKPAEAPVEAAEAIGEAPVAETLAPTPKAASAPARAAQPVREPLRRRLSQGDHGPKVDEVQQALAAKGFDPGPVNGRYGTLTAKAVRRFQDSVGLRVTGEVTPATWEALLS